MKGKMNKLAVLMTIATMFAMPAVMADSAAGTTSVTVLNAAPSVASGVIINEDGNNGTSQIDPTENSVKLVRAQATATDANGGDDVSSVYCWWTNSESGEIYNGAGIVDTNTISGDTVKVNCTQNLNYNDDPAKWDVIFEVTDDNAEKSASNETVDFYYMPAAYIDLNATEVNWAGGLTLGATDSASTDSINVNNTGNSIVDLYVKGTNLVGNPDATEEIPLSGLSLADDGSAPTTEYTATQDVYVAYTDGADLAVDGDVQMVHFLDVPASLKDQDYSGTITVCAALDGETC